MSKQTPLEEAVRFLSHDQRFHLVLNDLVERRESAISELGRYKSDSDLRKAAAEVTVFTEILDIFGVPTGTAQEPPV